MARSKLDRHRRSILIDQLPLGRRDRRQRTVGIGKIGDQWRTLRFHLRDVGARRPTTHGVWLGLGHLSIEALDPGRVAAGGAGLRQRLGQQVMPNPAAARWGLVAQALTIASRSVPAPVGDVSRNPANIIPRRAYS